jgi:hypothetical protein
VTVNPRAARAMAKAIPVRNGKNALARTMVIVGMMKNVAF